jgi:hypothetical protein
MRKERGKGPREHRNDISNSASIIFRERGISGMMLEISLVKKEDAVLHSNKMNLLDPKMFSSSSFFFNDDSGPVLHNGLVIKTLPYKTTSSGGDTSHSK